jgi:hypothetical protein
LPTTSRAPRVSRTGAEHRLGKATNHRKALLGKTRDIRTAKTDFSRPKADDRSRRVSKTVPTILGLQIRNNWDQ